MRAIMVFLVAIVSVGLSIGQKGKREHPGKPVREHPGKPVKEHPGRPPVKVTPEMIRKGITRYIHFDTRLKGGYFLIYDSQKQKPLALRLIRVHDQLNRLTPDEYQRIFKEKPPVNQIFFACVDFREVKTGRVWDLDFFMRMTPMGMHPFRIVIHKEGGKARIQYPAK